MGSKSNNAPPTASPQKDHEALIAELGSSADIVIGISVGLVLLLGLVLTFKGKKYFVRLMTITAFIVGAGAPLYFAIYHKQELSKSALENQKWWILGPVSFVCAIIASVLTHFFHKVAVFAAGAFGGGLLANIIMKLVNESHVTNESECWNDHGGWVSIAVCILCGMIVSFIAIKVLDPALRALTAFIGSFLITTSTAYFLEMTIHETMFLSWKRLFHSGSSTLNLMDEYALWCFIGWGCLGVIGILVQFREMPNKKIAEDLQYPIGRETMVALQKDVHKLWDDGV